MQFRVHKELDSLHIYNSLVLFILGIKMFQKLAPLIVLSLFVTGMYFMIQGMDNAVEITTAGNKSEIKK
jgi:hypothetical protein